MSQDSFVLRVKGTVDKSSISYLRDVFDEGGWGGSETVGLFRAIGETLEASVWLS